MFLPTMNRPVLQHVMPRSAAASRGLLCARVDASTTCRFTVLPRVAKSLASMSFGPDIAMPAIHPIYAADAYLDAFDAGGRACFNRGASCERALVALSAASRAARASARRGTCTQRAP